VNVKISTTSPMLIGVNFINYVPYAQA
jgi:hypothetical protein